MTRRALLTILLVLVVAGSVAVVLWMRDRAARTSEPAPSDTATTSRRLQQQQGPLDEAALSKLIREPLWQRRASTAWGLTERPDIPATRRAMLLLDVLQREITSPTRARPLEGSYLPLTGFLRIHYLHALETLGPEARDPVRDAQKNSRGEVREWYTLALGATLAPDAGPALRELVLKSSHPEVRMTAARYLGWLKDRDAVPALRAALKDTATAVTVSDVVGPPRYPFYPVREQAAGALKELGLKVERRGDTFNVQ